MKIEINWGLIPRSVGGMLDHSSKTIEEMSYEHYNALCESGELTIIEEIAEDIDSIPLDLLDDEDELLEHDYDDPHQFLWPDTTDSLDAEMLNLQKECIDEIKRLQDNQEEPDEEERSQDPKGDD